MEAHMTRAGTHATLMLSMTITALCVGLMACSSSPKQSDAHMAAPAQSQQTQPQRFDLKGKVVSIDKPGKKLTVDHEDIPGFMGAMTMAYPVKDEHLLDNLSPGDQVTAKVVSTGGGFWLENIVTVSTAPTAKSKP
jgi:Cu/Ag efflux protein CusF